MLPNSKRPPQQETYLQQLNVTARVDGVTQLRVLPFGQVVLLLADQLLLGANVLRSARRSYNYSSVSTIAAKTMGCEITNLKIRTTNNNYAMHLGELVYCQIGYYARVSTVLKYWLQQQQQ